MMTLPTIHEVTSMFLYGSEVPPGNFIDDDLTTDRGIREINIDTDEFLDPDNGPGRFVVASSSVMMLRFFETAAADYAAGVFSAHQDASTGIVSMSKDELDEIYGLTANNIWHGISVDNKWIYDNLDDYAARTYIYGNISFKISEDVNFVIYPDGRLEVQNFSLEILNGNDFDWTTRVGDILTSLGNTVLKRAIDPSGIGQTVLLNFNDATSFTYTQADYNADVIRAGSFSTVVNPLSISQAMGGVIHDLYEEGTIQTVMDGKLVLYGSDDADVIGPYLSRTGVNVSDPGLDLPNPLHEHTDDGLIYVAGAGNDTITGTSNEDVLFGGQGADHLFGGSGDDFIFFDAEDGANINGGEGRDVAVALGQDGVTVDMIAQGLEVVIGCDGDDTITVGGGTDMLCAAGGDGADTFLVSYDQSEGLKILWGGIGADTFIFDLNDYENETDGQLGIAVVTINGLTAEMFAGLTIDDLGLGGIDLSKIDTVILNPDTEDVFKMNGWDIDAAGLVGGWDPVEGGLIFATQASSYLGGLHAIQSLFSTDLWMQPEYTKDFEYFWVRVTPQSTEVLPSDGFDGMRWSGGQMAWVPFDPADPEVQAAVAEIEAEAADWFDTHGSEPMHVQSASDVPVYPFFVVGGSFQGTALVNDDGFSPLAPATSRTMPFDWLMAA